MLSAYFTLITILSCLALIAHRKHQVSHKEVVSKGVADTLPLLFRIPAAILAGSFLAELIPKAYVVALLGDSSGLQGILLASILGGFLPGGPMIAFPLLLALFKAGMGIPQMIALLTAWLLLAFHRIIAFELPMLGSRFVRRRLLACLPLPLLAGIAALAADNLF
ncbi:hypothetical protein [Marinobacter sp. BSs20148]|jgi:uncharacterized membrane protein YraQ (UPF0718 family)|uniref:hypothetical protein n=1 Tax=Marinobacter sp. BSs20148 TaxID=490759 RepID=UPI0005A0C064|nr:hypothetical protein [Marinobacter sp. BSs20148]